MREKFFMFGLAGLIIGTVFVRTAADQMMR